MNQPRRHPEQPVGHPGGFVGRGSVLRRSVVVTLAAVIALTLGQAASPGSAASTDPQIKSGGCTDLIFYGIRGSGQQVTGVNKGFGQQAFTVASTIAQDLDDRGKGTPVLTASYVPNSYPATNQYNIKSTRDQSVNDGIKRTIAYIMNSTTNCPKSQFVVVGYSQGAAVAQMAMAKIGSDETLAAAREAIVGVVLLASPIRQPSDPSVKHAVYGDGPAPFTGGWNDYYPDVFVSETMSGLIYSGCHAKDDACNHDPAKGPMKLDSNHTAPYQTSEVAKKVENWVYGRLVAQGR